MYKRTYIVAQFITSDSNMSVPSVIILFPNRHEYEIVRDFCFIQELDFIEEISGGFDTLLLYRASEIEFVEDFCDLRLITYFLYQTK